MRSSDRIQVATYVTWFLSSAKLYFLIIKRTATHVRAHHEHPIFSLVLLPHTILAFFRHLLAMADSAGMMYALATIMSILAIVAVMLRFYARRIKQTALSWDDYVILPALVCHFGYCT